MTYHVIITDRAEADIQHAFDWWSENRSREQATRWYEGIYPAIESLARSPRRFGYASERELVPTLLRQMPYGIARKPSHRILYTIDGDDVIILRVRHVAQAAFAPGELS
jgi:plasmid stabilization system protein ParE